MKFLSKLFYDLKPHVGDIFEDENPFSSRRYKIEKIMGKWIKYTTGSEKGFYGSPDSTIWSVFYYGKKKTYSFNSS